MEYCPDLTKGDYLLRTKVNVSDLFKDYQVSKEGSYLAVHQIPVGMMHKLMKLVLQKDKTAFMVSLPDQEVA
jgi:homoserine dehydrogenase